MKHAVSVSKATKFIVDDNFAADKMRAKEILRGMIAEKIRTRWSAQVRTDVARDPELLRLMADSGCHTLFIGFESINPRTLEEYNEKQDLEDIISCIRKVRYHGIHIHGMFVLGGRRDYPQTVDFAEGIGLGGRRHDLWLREIRGQGEKDQGGGEILIQEKYWC